MSIYIGLKNLTTNYALRAGGGARFTGLTPALLGQVKVLPPALLDRLVIVDRGVRVPDRILTSGLKSLKEHSPVLVIQNDFRSQNKIIFPKTLAELGNFLSPDSFETRVWIDDVFFSNPDKQRRLGLFFRIYDFIPQSGKLILAVPMDLAVVDYRKQNDT